MTQDLPQRIGRTIQEYDLQGWHRTGTRSMLTRRGGWPIWYQATGRWSLANRRLLNRYQGENYI